MRTAEARQGKQGLHSKHALHNATEVHHEVVFGPPRSWNRKRGDNQFNAGRNPGDKTNTCRLRIVQTKKSHAACWNGSPSPNDKHRKTQAALSGSLHWRETKPKIPQVPASPSVTEEPTRHCFSPQQSVCYSAAGVSPKLQKPSRIKNRSHVLSTARSMRTQGSTCDMLPNELAARHQLRMPLSTWQHKGTTDPLAPIRETGTSH